MIPYMDLEAQHASLREELLAAIAGVLDSRQFILGKHVADFEARFAQYCGTKYAVALNSGTSALHLALLAAGVEPGDEVITVPFTFIATVAAVRYCGARPVLVDIDPASFTIDVEQVERAITSKTKAILPVHLYGQCAEMDELNRIAQRHGLKVIEDAAQAHGAEYKGRRAGSLGDSGCFSFYPTKNLGACGEGGMVTTNNDGMAEKIRLLRDWGQAKKYHHVLHAFNYRMEGFQGAILDVKLKYLEQWTEARRQAAAWYGEALSGAPVIRPAVLPDRRHVFHIYSVRSSGRDALQQKLGAAGVQTAIHYAIPSHLQEAYRDPAYPEGSLPNAERAAKEVLALPIFPTISRDAVNCVASLIRNE